MSHKIRLICAVQFYCKTFATSKFAMVKQGEKLGRRFLCFLVFNIYLLVLAYFFPLAQQPKARQHYLSLEFSRSHKMTHHSW